MKKQNSESHKIAIDAVFKVVKILNGKESRNRNSEKCKKKKMKKRDYKNKTYGYI